MANNGAGGGRARKIGITEGQRNIKGWSADLREEGSQNRQRKGSEEREKVRDRETERQRERRENKE